MTLPLLLLALASASGPSGAGAPAYALDARESALLARTHKTGAASALAHDHAIRATELTGALSYDPAKPGEARVEVEVKVASMAVDQPADRKALGLEGGPGDKDRKEITENMLAEGQLDAAHFPSIRFVSTSAQPAEGGLVLEGKLTLHGVTRPVKLPVKVEQKDGVVRGEGRLTIKQTDFGIQPYRAFMGMVGNQDEVDLVLRLVARPKG